MTMNAAATITPATNREEWLVRALPQLIKLTRDAGAKVYATPFVSVGFPHKGGMAKKKRVIGQCWTIPDERRSHIFVSPLIDEPVQALDILLHELIHAAEPKAGHKGAFKRIALELGMTGKMTATVAGPELAAKLREIIVSIGPFPHRALTAETLDAAPKQGTRMIKLECPRDGYTVRTTRKWLDIGVPKCPCGTEMVCDDDLEPIVIAGPGATPDHDDDDQGESNDQEACS